MTDPDRPTAPPPDDPGHLLPDEDWQRVVREAEEEAERIRRGRPPAQLATEVAAGRHGTGLAIPTSGTVVARSHGGRRPRGWPSFGVLHDAETPLRAGFAASIARYLAGSGVSAHYMVDPAETWGVLPDELVAYHVGGANLNSLGVEQAGYASFTRAQWTTADGLAQMRRVAAIMREAAARYGIGRYWMTDQQLRDAHSGRIVGGWTTHNRCRLVIGGTSHTDPDPNYPYADLMALAVGGEDEDMPTPEEYAAAVWKHPLAGLKVPTAAGTVLTDARSIARRGEAAVLALQQALAATGTVVTADQLDVAMRAAQQVLDEEDGQ